MEDAMFNLPKKFHPFHEIESIDALLALQMLEEQEHTKEQEFFRITSQLDALGVGGQELEAELPQLLKTKRERALYKAFMQLLQSRSGNVLPAQTAQRQRLNGVSQELACAH
jgi:hypothetical protein